MKPLKLTHTRKALEEFDTFHGKWVALWDNHLMRINNRRALFLLRLHDEAEMNVRIAFHKDTDDRNCLENCKLVGLSWLREMVAKED